MSDTKQKYKCSCGAGIDSPEGEIIICPECNNIISDSSEKTVKIKRTNTFKNSSSATSSNALENLGLTNGNFEDLKSGTLLDHFKIDSRISRGGMGTVYRAMDLSLDRWVALKVINNQQILKDKVSMEAFIHEARAQAQVNHPGIAIIYYIGFYHNMPYFVMEFIDGSDLDQDFSENPISIGKVIDIGIQVTKALAEANDKGVIHRDLKPANIIVTKAGNAKLTDFGLAKTNKEGSLKLTGSKNMIGTPNYIAPEQAAGLETDFRTDIYSLGATLYHLAYGHPPFKGNNFMEVVSKHMSETPNFSNLKVRNISPGFPEVLKRMMEKQLENRYQSYEELEAALLNVRPETRKAASLIKRLLAFLIDLLQFNLLYFIGYFAIIAFQMIREPNPSKHTFEKVLQDPIAFLGFLLFLWLIFGIIQIFLGRSLGKFFMHLKLMSLKGACPERKILAVRSMLEFLPAATILFHFTVLPLPQLIVPIILVSCLIDVFCSLINSNKRTLHDLLLGTWVVQEAEHK